MAVCRFFSRPGGCRRGDDCTFQHVASADPASSSRAPTDTGSDTNWRARPASGAGAGASSMNVYSPRGTCREFYLTGSCARFGTPGGCRFRHDKSGESRATTSFSPFGALLPLSRAQPATPASPQELASAAKGVKSDALSPVVPSLRVDRSILFKVANDPDFKFHEPYQVYPWLNSLYASTQVKALLSTHEESQNVLAALANAEGPGMARLIEFLNFPQGIQVGGSPSADKLSFQRGFMAFVFWLTSGEIRGSVLTHHLNRIYHVLHIHAPAWAASTSTCLDSLMRAQTVKDPRLFGRSAGFAPANFLQIFGPLAQVLHEYLSRFRDAVVKNPSVQSLVTTLSTNFRIYAEAISNGSTEYDSSSFADARQHRFLIAGVRQSINTLLEIIDRIQVVPFVASVPTSITTSIPSLAALAALKRLFEPPGELRVGGPRHDNDKANIREIQILPTHAELLCPLPAFVPSNLPDGPSHLPVGSIDRQLDIVFRLLREDFVGPLRAAVSSIFADLQTLDDPSNALGALIKRGGGRYRPSSSAHADTSDLKVYAAVEFVGIRLSQQHELQLDLKLDFPEAFARSKVVRHLPSGSLVGLICRRTSSRAERANGANTHGPIDLGDATIFLGLVTEEARSSGPSRRSVGISFFEGGLYLEALRQLEAQRKGDTEHGEMICFEVPGFLLGTLKPFLQALQTIEPATLPFAKYLSALPPLPNSSIAIDPPLFARAPDFAYDLSSCLSAETPPGTLLLNIQDQDSIDSVRQTLTESSRLDPSQVGALIDCLSREVALVRGPPGTGKSWLGVELIRTLLASKVGKVLVLSYTNHALDTMLKHLMEQVTKEIIRAGSRSKDPAMADFNLNNRAFEQSRHLGRISHEVKELWTRRTELQKAIAAVCELATRVARQQIHFDHLERYLGISYPHHLASLCVVPFSLVSAHEQLFDEGWQIATSSRDAPSSTQLPTHPAAIFAWWRDGGDIALEEKAQLERDTAAKAFEDHLQQFAQQTKSRYDLLPIEESDSDSGDASISDSGSNATLDWFNDAHSELTENEEGSQNESEEEHEEQRYEPPCGDRSIAELANDHDVWKYSRAERDRVLEAWAEDLVRREGPHLDNLRHQQDEVNLRLKALNNDAKLRVLQDADIIGATTNSASNLLEIVAAAKPAVLVVEEAGECLEAQVIANLVPSIQHLIMIGDEKQLRPQISSYHLSTDSSQGSAHRHDVSLFERLALLPLPVSMLKTQRRMRPEISCLIRNFLYPELEDAPSVREYPNVKGMRENVFFIDHRLPEDAQAVDHSSKSNTQEATFVVDLVRHLLYQGYGGRIAVICPYLGQVAALKRELERETISVAIDDRDAEDLAAAREVEEHSQEEGASEEESALKPAQAAMRTPKSQVDLRTIDRFQGEEADIVILSLVRNSASPFEEEEGQRFYSLDRAAKSGIGFLKSSNRTNVAISRARHGMYLFGDAQLLSEKSKMWKSIVAQLDEQDAIAPHLPARCDHHPDKSLEIDRPGKLQQLSPNGGCLERCEAMLTCGHECARICHADDPEHRLSRCIARCPVLLECSHPCSGLCSMPHPKCTFNIPRLELDCGHFRTNVPCFLANGGLVKIECKEKVSKTLPCGHEELLACSTDAAGIVCSQVCGGELDCLHATCNARCGECRALRAVSGDPSAHKPHPHGKNLACGHICQGDCVAHVKAKQCPTECQQVCLRSCSHGSCTHACAVECPGCLLPCDTCTLPCSSPCNTIPSDEACSKSLSCGHPCPSLRGEDCSYQVCPQCANDDRKAQVVDYILLSTLGEFDEADQDPANRLMTIDCGHSLSVATLDGLFEFDIFYRKDEKGCVIGLAHPQTSDKEVVRCPTCKTPITSRSVKRYGRSLKHREATVQERLWTIRGQAIIKDAADFVDSLPISQINDRVTKFRVSCLGKASSSAREAKENQRRFLKSFAADFVLPDIFRDRRITGLSKPLSSFWTGATSPLLKALCKLDEVGSRKSPYSKAYDAAVSQLFYEEKERLSTTPNLIRDIDEGALEFALSAAGVARPTTDLKLLLQHVWLSLEVRSSLAKITARLACIVHTHESSSVQTDHQSLLNMASFIFKTSIRDVDMTISLAHERRCGRLKMEGQLRRLQVLLAQNSFFARSRVEYKVAPRNAVHDFAEDTRRNSLLAFDRAVVEFCEEQPLQRGWLDEQILPGRDKIAEQWKSLLQEVQGHFYQQVTDEELKLVIQSQEFATSSHWYICPNGHTYTIGDCGGAVMQAQCPECGATIGGAGHRVAEGNHHDERMIRLTRESTDARHEFPWGRQ